MIVDYNVDAFVNNVQVLEDVNGNAVPCIIDGVTYLPMRATGEILGMEVDYYTTLGKPTPIMANTIEKRELTMLTYHSITDNPNDNTSMDVYVGEFNRQIRELASEGYSFLTIDEIEEISDIPIGKNVIIAFDDGYSNIIKALPVLNEVGGKATVFVNLYNVINNVGLPKLSVEELIDLQTNNDWAIGNHQHKHERMYTLADATVDYNYTYLQAINVSNQIALPFNHYTNELMDAIMPIYDVIFVNHSVPVNTLYYTNGLLSNSVISPIYYIDWRGVYV